MSVITLSSSFGSGGSVVAQRIADRLGWPLLNRAITAEVANELSVPLDLAEAHDEQAHTGWRRLLENLTLGANVTAEASALTADAISDEVRLRRATERVLLAAAATDTVIVGRAAAIVLKDRDDALHVRLDGPRAGRIRQGAGALGITLEDAARKLDQVDQARAAYVKELYGMNWRDSILYHLTLDSTVFALDTCTELTLAAAKARFGTAFSDKRL